MSAIVYVLVTSFGWWGREDNNIHRLPDIIICLGPECPTYCNWTALFLEIPDCAQVWRQSEGSLFSMYISVCVCMVVRIRISRLSGYLLPLNIYLCISSPRPPFIARLNDYLLCFPYLGWSTFTQPLALFITLLTIILNPLRKKLNFHLK